MAQRVSDQLKRQDRAVVLGVRDILAALQERYAGNLELKSAIRDMQDLAKVLEGEVDAAAERAAAAALANGNVEDVRL